MSKSLNLLLDWKVLKILGTKLDTESTLKKKKSFYVSWKSFILTVRALLDRLINYDHKITKLFNKYIRMCNPNICLYTQINVGLESIFLVK